MTCDPAGTVEALLANLQPSNALVTAGHSVWLILRAVGAMLQQFSIISENYGILTRVENLACAVRLKTWKVAWLAHLVL